jgi:outer membrane protein assembly factor BamD (BamD/ComL family)
MRRIIPVLFLCLVVAAVVPAFAEETAAALSSGAPAADPVATPAVSPAPSAGTSAPAEPAEQAAPTTPTVRPEPSKPAAVVQAAPETQVKKEAKASASETTAQAVAADFRARRAEALKAWQFLKENGKDSREEMTATTLFQLVEFRRLNPDWDFSDQALLLTSELRRRMEDYKGAVVDLLSLIYEYPDSSLVFRAKSTMEEIIQKKLGKKLKPVLVEVAKGSKAKEKSERLAQLLKKLVAGTGDELYEPLVAQFDEFFWRFPSYTGLDELNVTCGDLQRNKEKYLTAQTYYRKVLALYPESRFRPRAQRSIADVYVSDLKDVHAADNAYQEVINQYPDSEEAAYAYEQMAKIEEQLKHYDLSVELNEKIVQRYPNKNIALRAFNNEARILLDSLEKPNEAIRVYRRLADMFKGSDNAAEALKSAAVLARKNKNYDLEIEMYERFANECSSNKEAPELSYQAGQVAEDDLARPDRAVELYGKVVENFPGDSYAKKAKKRIEKLTKEK